MFKNSKTRPLFILGVLYIVALVLIGAAFVAAPILNIPLENFSADLAAIYGAHPFEGMISYIGIMLWCATAAVCIFSYAILRPRSTRTRFLLAAGLLSLLLFLDDLFQLHEAIIPWYLKIPETYIYAAYGALFSGWLFYFRKQIFNTEFGYLILAFLLLGCSVLGDLLLPQEGQAYLIGDGLKLLGIVTWFFYFIRVCYRNFPPVLYSVKRGEALSAEAFNN